MHSPRGSSVLAVGFGATVAMWVVGFVGRLPAVRLPSPLLLALLLACILAGGVVLGRRAGLGWRGGAAAGALCGALNLLVLGGILAGDHPGSVVPAAALWLPGSILIAAALGAAGAAIGVRPTREAPRVEDWTGALAKIAACAALLLVGVGGLVTSAEAGLAVVDWPNTFGYNMFLYPFSRMTGGIYYEHSHRLFGALVGLTTLVLAAEIQLVERRRWVRALAWSILGAVVVQGVLGGLRVTGGFTLSTDPDAMRPSLLLAMVHGVGGQLLLAALVALGALTSRRWREAPPPGPADSASVDRVVGAALLAVLIVQLVLGAAQRHFAALLLVHVAVGVAFVTPLAVHAGMRAWGLHGGRPPLPQLGIALCASIAVQLALGLGAWLATGSGVAGVGAAIAVATAHQWFGAVLLGLAVLLNCWNLRLVGRPVVKARPAVGGPAESSYR